MTDEQILKLAETCGFEWFTGEKDDGTQSDYWECWEQQLLKFARAIRKETIEEVLILLKDVPNPEANRTAINRIMSMNND
jgi:hypothetical protein